MIMRPSMPPELRALLDEERGIPRLSASRRARAMARARESLAASVMAAGTEPAGTPRSRWAAAVAAGLVISAAVGAAAYELHVRSAPATSTRQAAKVAATVIVAPAPASPPPTATIPQLAPALASSSSAPASAERAELHLLQQARAAVARGDFAAALSPIAEHTRLFKNGRLAEEREALRVKALVGLGRVREARHAAAAFRARFPRSVLSPAVSQMPVSPP